MCQISSNKPIHFRLFVHLRAHGRQYRVVVDIKHFGACLNLIRAPLLIHCVTVDQVA